MTKKILSIFLILILLFSLTGCNKKNNSNDNATSSESQTNSDSNSGDSNQNSTSGSSSEITKVTIDDCKTAIDDTFNALKNGDVKKLASLYPNETLFSLYKDSENSEEDLSKTLKIMFADLVWEYDLDNTKSHNEESISNTFFLSSNLDATFEVYYITKDWDHVSDFYNSQLSENKKANEEFVPIYSYQTIDDTFKVMNYLSNKLPLLAHNSINIQFNSSTKKVRISPDSIFRKEITGILYKAASGHSSNSSQSYLLGEVLDTDIKGSIKYRKSSDFMINSINDNSDVNSKLLKIGDYLTQKKDFELYSYLQSLNDKHTTGDFYVSYLDELSEEKKTLIEAQYKNMLQIVTNFDVLKSSASNSLHVLHVVRYYNLLDDYYKNNNLKDYKAFADKHKAYTNCSYWDAYDNIGGVHYSPMDTLKDLVKSAN